MEGFNNKKDMKGPQLIIENESNQLEGTKINEERVHQQTTRHSLSMLLTILRKLKYFAMRTITKVK